MSSGVGTVVNMEGAVYREAFHKLKGHLCNCGRYGLEMCKRDLTQGARLSLYAKVLIELDNALASVRALMELEARLSH